MASKVDSKAPGLPGRSQADEGRQASCATCCPASLTLGSLRAGLWEGRGTGPRCLEPHSLRVEAPCLPNLQKGEQGTQLCRNHTLAPNLKLGRKANPKQNTFQAGFNPPQSSLEECPGLPQQVTRNGGPGDDTSDTYSLSSGGQSPKSGRGQAWTPPEAPGRVLPASSSSWQLWAFLAVTALLRALPPSSSLPRASDLPVSHKDPQLDCLHRPFFPVRSHSRLPGFGPQPIFWGPPFSPLLPVSSPQDKMFLNSDLDG